jgi:hypothetical protein
MTKAKAPPAGSASGKEAARQREARLAAALRANLGRRKVQVRGREADTKKPDNDRED